MPTGDRPAFVRQSIWYFLRQDYGARELLILDDGYEAVASLVPRDPRIRYVRLARRMGLGAKRNLGCELAAGDLVAHWDDDDWIAPHRLSAQVRAVFERESDLCLIGDVLHYRLREGQAWRCRTPDYFGGTLVYRKEAWRARPFANDSRDEIRGFIDGFHHSRVTDCEGVAAYVAIAHPDVASAREFDDRRWERRPIHEVGWLLGPDADFYRRLRTASRHERIEPIPTSRVRVAAPFLVYDGYGSMAEYLVLGMLRSGAIVDVTPLRLDLSGTTDDFQHALRLSAPVSDEPTLCFVWWGDDLRRFKTTDLFVNTMWESSRIPVDWPSRLAIARAVIVPTRFVANAFRSCGVQVPVEVVPQGVDPSVYHWLERPVQDGLTTLMVGVFVPRKNILLGVDAWSRAFANDPAARLVIKSRFGGASYTPVDPRITIVDTHEASRGIAGWYRNADIFMALGNEGFGLPLVEAMATGLPVIALDAEGQSDVCTEAKDFVLRVPPRGWQPVDEPPYGTCGVRALPAVEDIAAQLRWVAEHRDEARALGTNASKWVLAHRNVWTMGPAVLQVMESHIVPRRPLRRQPTVCCPESDTDMTDYAQDLATARPWIRLVATPGDLRAARVLHFQWAPGTWDDTALTRLVQEARLSGLPIAITEHSIESTARAWEPLASAVVVHSASDAGAIQARWPDQRVEVLEMGCPTWFPPRKRVKGRVLGIVGYPRRSHGWWDALSVLHRVRGTRLLVVARGGLEQVWAAWMREASTMPIDVAKVETSRDAAVQLAAEADVVLLWHQPREVSGRSYGARMALASGVPVITSAVPEFDDLEGVTYRPESLVDGVAHILEDCELRSVLIEAARAFCESHSWERTADRHEEMWRSLECA